MEIFGIIVSLQPRTASGGGISREDQIGLIAADLEKDMIPAWDEEKVKLVYPIDYHESMNTILGQEIAKYNRVVRMLNSSLKQLQLAINGDVGARPWLLVAGALCAGDGAQRGRF